MRRAALAAAVAAMMPGMATACAYLTQHFELCTEGTDWAKGRWEQGGDSATLYLGKIGYEGFEEYLAHDPKLSIEAELAAGLAGVHEVAPVAPIERDRPAHPTLSVVRSIDMVTFNEKPELRVTMIADAGTERIMIMVRAPADTPLDTIRMLSQGYLELVRLTPDTAGN